MLTDEVNNPTLKCAEKVFYRHGFKYWNGWVNNCKQKPLPNLRSCFNKRV